MTTPTRPDHTKLAKALRDRVVEGRGESDRALRQTAVERSAGGPAMAEPYDALVRQIGEAAYGVTDAQVASVLRATGNEKAVFEIVASAAVGAAFLRWQHAMKALNEAKDAPTGN